MEVNTPPPNRVKVTRGMFGTFYDVLYHRIESHLESSSAKPRSWKIWEEWKSNGMRNRMASYVKISKIWSNSNIKMCTTNLILDGLHFLGLPPSVYFCLLQSTFNLFHLYNSPFLIINHASRLL